MMQATTAGSVTTLDWVADIADSPGSAALLAAVFDFLHDTKRRRAQAAGTAQILVALARQHPARGADLAVDLHLDQSTISRHLASLESEGLVRRVPNQRDRRVQDIELTDTGRTAAHAEVRRRVKQLESAVTGWSEQDVADLGRLLRRFVDALRTVEVESNP